MKEKILLLKTVFFIFLILPLPLADSKMSKGNAGRGLSGASKPKPNVMNTNQQNRGNTGFGQQAKSGLGSSSSSFGRSSFKMTKNKALVGGILAAGAAGYVGYKIGQASGRMHYDYGGNRYYYGTRYYPGVSSGRRACIFEVDESTPNWNLVDEVDNTRVKEIVFECASYQSCCDMQCCNNPTNTHVHYRSTWRWWQTLLVLFALASLFACCAFFIVRKRRNAAFQNNSVPITTLPDNSYPQQNKPYDSNPSGYYPVNQQQQSYYPPAPGSAPPPYGGYPPTYGYPPAPTNYPPNYPQASYQPVPTY